MEYLRFIRALRRRINELLDDLERLDDDAYREIEEEIERLCEWHRRHRHHPCPPPPPTNQPTHAVLTIQGETMASEISVDSTTATLSLSFIDDKGEATAAPAGATVAYASDNAAVATVDAASGKITPVLAGTFNASASVTNADGTPTLEPDGVTPFSPAPVNVTVDPGAASGDVFTVTP